MVTMTNEAARAAWEGAQRERQFWQLHQDEYLAKYPNQFVAVADGEVIATAPTLEEILALLEQEGREPTDVWLRFFNASRDTTFF